MKFRVQFFGPRGEPIKESHYSVRNAAAAMALVKPEDWPPKAVRLVVTDSSGERHAERPKHF